MEWKEEKITLTKLIIVIKMTETMVVRRTICVTITPLTIVM